MQSCLTRQIIKPIEVWREHDYYGQRHWTRAFVLTNILKSLDSECISLLGSVSLLFYRKKMVRPPLFVRFNYTFALLMIIIVKEMASWICLIFVHWTILKSYLITEMLLDICPTSQMLFSKLAFCTGIIETFRCENIRLLYVQFTSFLSICNVLTCSR